MENNNGRLHGVGRIRIVIYLIAISPLLISLFWGKWFSSRSSVAASGSLLSVEGDGFADLGIRTPNELLFHRFEVQNPSQNYARIEKVESSCRCLIVADHEGTETFVGQILKPNGTLPVTFGIDTEGLINRVSGKLLLTARFYADVRFDPSEALGEQKLLLEIAADIPGDVDANPAEVNFGQVNRDRNDTLIKEVKIERKRDEVDWEFIRVTDPIFKVVVDSEHSNIKFTLDKDRMAQKSAGLVSGFAEIAISRSPQKKLFIPLEVMLVDELTIQPPFLTFRKFDEVKSIKLTGAEPFILEEMSIAGKSIELPRMILSNQHEFTVSLPSDVPGKGVVELTVRFENSTNFLTKTIDYFDLERN